MAAIAFTKRSSTCTFSGSWFVQVGWSFSTTRHERSDSGRKHLRGTIAARSTGTRWLADRIPTRWLLRREGAQDRVLVARVPRAPSQISVAQSDVRGRSSITARRWKSIGALSGVLGLRSSDCAADAEFARGAGMSVRPRSAPTARLQSVRAARILRTSDPVRRRTPSATDRVRRVRAAALGAPSSLDRRIVPRQLIRSIGVTPR